MPELVNSAGEPLRDLALLVKLVLLTARFDGVFQLAAAGLHLPGR